MLFFPHALEFAQLLKTDTRRAQGLGAIFCICFPDLEACQPSNQICTGSSFECGSNYVQCGTGGLGDICFCDQTTEGTFFCGANVNCGESNPCTSSSQCTGGAKCMTTCCNEGLGSCIPVCPSPYQGHDEKAPVHVEPGLCNALSSCDS